ncbi:hypothetical protein CRE_15935 [Caenorhabditis remanei]|uniref:glucuronosyltransferase n=1 Tax=Caenorhabditis remanei TaxID=31234 RepID=E3MBM7_CAERE|nr:hypothetical protein CRE_15935 [Caenorhabditis remanei]
MKLAAFFPLFFNFLPCVTYKVLVFNPAFGASHSNYLGKISDILIDAGHEVTMLIPTFMEAKKELVGSKKVSKNKIIRIEQDSKCRKMEEESKFEEIMRKTVWTDGGDTASLFLSWIKNFAILSGWQCANIFQQTTILENLKNENFDLGITEALSICGFPLFDHIGVKAVINADSLLHLDIVKYAHGEPASTSFFPGVFSTDSDKMSFLGRLKNLIGLSFPWYFSWARFQSELDILVVVVFLLLALLAIIFCIFRFIFRKLCNLFFGGFGYILADRRMD